MANLFNVLIIAAIFMVGFAKDSLTLSDVYHVVASLPQSIEHPMSALCMINARDERQLEQMEDELIEQEHLSERFQERNNNRHGRN